jgi:hypothetical protein
MPHHYNLIGYQTVNGSLPHGLFHGNDTFFYLTSWQDNTVYTYSNAGNITSWRETLLLNARPLVNSSNGHHVSIDNTGRYWFSLGDYGTKIFDAQRSLLGTLHPTNSLIFDTLITDNYVIYLADIALDRIIRIEPNLQC